jgi:hypothetical protein
VRDLLGGYIDIVRAYPRVTAICLASAVGCVPGYFFMSSAVVYATHLGQPATFLTVLFGALAVGGFLGGVWSKHGQKHGYLNATTSGVLTLLFIPMWGLLAFTKVAWVALCLLVVIEVADAATVIVFDVFAQRVVPDHLQGRLVALILWSAAFAEVTGALIVTCLSTSQAVGALVPVSLGSLLPVAIAGGIWVLAPQEVPLPQLKASSTAG